MAHTKTLAAGIRIEPLARDFGAKAFGLDARNLSDGELEALKDAVHHYAIVVLPGQDLSAADQAKLTARLGPRRETSILNSFPHPESADVTILSNIVEDGRPIGISDAGISWHTDASYARTPSMYSLLYGVQIPKNEAGESLGSTHYANTAAAYDALPGDMKRRIANLKAVHSYSYHTEKKQREGTLTRPPLSPETLAQFPEVEHPVVRTHPITGRKSLYVTESHTARIAGVSPAESEELLAQLLAHIRRPEFLYTHRWEAGDLVVWDDCTTQHSGTKDYGSIPRRMHQSAVEGPVPV